MEHLRSERHVIQDICFRGELFPRTATKSVAAVINLNEQMATLIQSLHENPTELANSGVFKKKTIPLQVVLRDYQDMPFVIASVDVKIDDKENPDGTIKMFDYVNGLKDLPSIIDANKDESKNAVIIYDLLSSFNSTILPHSQKEQQEVRATLHRYFSFLNTFLKHGGILLVQLESGSNEEKVQADKYNDYVLQALALSGFNAKDTTTCQKFPYERSAPYHTTGILHVFKQQGYADGEPRPEVVASEPLWMKEAQKIAEKSFQKSPVTTNSRR